MEPADVVLRFLESMGRRGEAEFYVNLFRSESKESFAAISVDANVARHATEAVVLHLRFLAGLGLFPVVLLGLFEPTDAPEHAARIRRRLERAGVPATLVPANDPALATTVAQIVRGGAVAIVVDGATEGATPEDRFAGLGRLLTALGTRKLLFMHRPGGLRQAGTLVPIVNLSKDYSAMSASRELSRKERALLNQSRRLIFELVPHKLVVAITSPLNLLRELFTTKGAGTMLRKGSVVNRRTSAEVDRDRMRALLTSSFGRPPRDDFFDRDFACVYLEENYSGAAIMESTPLGAYLTKFAVGREAQGEGIGRDLWDAMIADYPTVFWRARPTNPIGSWYQEQCDGMQRTVDWIVYWKGVAPERVPEAIAFSLAQPIDLLPLAPPPEPSISSSGAAPPTPVAA